ncbi:MAG: 16S rRNA (adenine(1518)-N(6)/adenine(1519)-N(6))-dimethyltransferase RsmA [Candidatus Micrarchaeota archaeon]|nr:16S rRNA (adenine(1518)-N(6)/adenine(1519)-N(6))-dimethyltransferase RsmA [Candidatus Micrarchaeota archaeon]
MEQVIAKKKWGQNFLGSEETAEKIASEIPAGKNVLEIGPGLGMLTGFLVERCKKLTCIEIDRELTYILEKKFANTKNVEIKHGDCLGEDFSKFDVVVGLLPYNISSRIIEKFVNSKCKTAIFVVQKEVGERIAGLPGSKNYSRLSVLCQNNCACELVEVYPPEFFWPVPKVHSSLVKMQRKKPLAIDQTLINALFQHKNQKIKKALKHSRHLLGEKVEKIIEKNPALIEKRVVELSIGQLSELGSK